MTYSGLASAQSAADPHLGGSIKAGDPFTYCPSVWEYMINRFAVSSVLDLGSGSGYASDFFHRKGLKVLAVDGLSENVKGALYPTIRHDLSMGPVTTKVDLVHCHEVVEHIEAEYLDNLLKSLCSGRVIVMTHALPGQDGHHHVNFQPSKYWIDAMSRYGCVLAAEDSRRVKALAKQDGAVYMRATGMVFINSSRI